MIKVLLAEDQHMIRAALVALLGLESDIDVVAEVSNGNDIIPGLRDTRPDIAIVDIDLPGRDGITVAAEIGRQGLGYGVLMLTNLSQPGTVRRALDAHVDGYMLKDASPEKLADALRRIHAGGRYVDGDLALSAWEAEKDPLTEREAEALRLAARGLSVADIASELVLSPGTVGNHLTNSVSKLNARNRVDAIRIATEAGWI